MIAQGLAMQGGNINAQVVEAHLQLVEQGTITLRLTVADQPVARRIGNPTRNSGVSSTLAA